LTLKSADNSFIEYNGAFLHDNAVADDELHSHILDKENWAKLWELSEKLMGEPFVV
jgi:hydroxymethylpyrimidine pyrophosphatase-like HAD family hydrolase